MFSNFTRSLPKNNRYEFDITGVDLSIVNSIRRIILADIPVVGFDGEIDPSLTIHANNGPLHNEFMLHRFGLIPIHMSPDETDMFEQDSYVFTLKVHNTTNITQNVTTADFTVTKDGQPLPEKEVARLFPADEYTGDRILITRLRPDEMLSVEGQAVKKTARHHAGFSPVSLCTFQFVADPIESANATNVLDKERAFMKNDYGDPVKIHFEIESETALTARYLFSKAIEILANKVHKTMEHIKNENSEFIKFERIAIGPSDVSLGAQITFLGEDDTLGNFLQSTMHNYYIREAHPAMHDNKVTYVGYYCPHPLDHTMIMRVNFAPSKTAPTDTDYIDTICEHCNRSLVQLQNIQAEWQEACKGAGLK